MHMDEPLAPPAAKRSRVSGSGDDDLDEATMCYIEDREQDLKPLIDPVPEVRTPSFQSQRSPTLFSLLHPAAAPLSIPAICSLFIP